MSKLTITIGNNKPMKIDDVDVKRTAESVPWSSLGHWVPDPDWSFTDAFGHEHHWEQGDDRWLHPTLVTTMVPCDEACGDPTHTVEEYHCAYCDIEVEPGWKHTGPQSGVIAGPQQMTISFWVDTKQLYTKKGKSRLPQPFETVAVEVHQDGEPYLAGRGSILDMSTDSNGSTVKMDFQPAEAKR